MSSVSDLIDTFNKSSLNADVTGKSCDELKKNANLKNISMLIRGGISKLKKDELLALIRALNEYEKDTYKINGKMITPDVEQMLIVKASPNVNMRIIAGAGSGKTTTIACRVKYLLDHVTTPDKILVLTFNVESRHNLEKMIDGLFGFDVKVEIKTIDSFCTKIIKDPAYKLSDKWVDYNSLSECGIMGRKVMQQFGSSIASQYQYVFFDEFQDVDKDQFLILHEFWKNGCKLIVVGDDSQNIYQFRGSDNYYMINFDRIIKGALTYKITTNYRSNQQIVTIANQSIINNTDRIHKVMKPFHDKIGIVDLTIVDKMTDLLDFITDKIKNYINDKTISGYADVAILARNNNNLKNIETHFQKIGIPHIALITDKFGNDKPVIEDEDRVVVSTIHKTKGLEWKILFMIDLADKTFPSHMNNGIKNIQEERRLFYVGITRPKTHLHFVVTRKEIPISRFIEEVKEHIQIDSEEDLFCKVNDDIKKRDYVVDDLIDMLSGPILEVMRDSNLLPNLVLDENYFTKQLFEETIHFTEEIAKNMLKSDYEIYCSHYIIRQLLISNKNQKIRDINAETILCDLHLSDEEKDLYDKYDLKNYLVTKELSKPIEQIDELKVHQLMEKLLASCAKTNTDTINTGEFCYPSSFMDKLKKAYVQYMDAKLGCDQTKDAIYQVSLCAKFNSGRRRLVYRDIKDLFEECNTVFVPRMNEYVFIVKDEKQICKIPLSKMYKINEESVTVSGEIQYIDVTNKTIVAIKCYEKDFKVEWVMELLTYYAMYVQANMDNNDYVDLKKIAIVNILTGRVHQIDIPDEYDWTGLLDYYEKLIERDHDGRRDKVNLDDMINSVDWLVSDVDENDDNDEDNKIDQTVQIVVELKEDAKKKGYIVLDVENNTVSQDIIQLAYIIYDDADKEIKRVNKYIKDRTVDSRAFQITGITTAILQKKGIDFKDVMKEFIEDLHGVNFMCGHYIDTDIFKLKSNLSKYKVKPSIDIFEKLQIIKTEDLYKTLGAGRATLGVMYKELFNTDMINAHDALADVVGTAKCYVEIKKRLENGELETKKTIVVAKPKKKIVKKVTEKN